MVFPFWIYVRETGVIHKAGTKYCKVEEVTPGRVWRYRFEDLDEEIGEMVDWDFNEPILLIERILWNKLRITGELFDGAYHVDIYFDKTLLFENIGGGRFENFGTVEATYVPGVLIAAAPITLGTILALASVWKR